MHPSTTKVYNVKLLCNQQNFSASDTKYITMAGNKAKLLKHSANIKCFPSIKNNTWTIIKNAVNIGIYFNTTVANFTFIELILIIQLSLKM